MKGLTAGLVFFSCSVVCAVLLGLIGGGLGPFNTWLSILIAIVAAVLAYFMTLDPERQPSDSPRRRYRWILFWFMAGCFIFFAVRSFCWLLYIDGPEFRIQSVNNLGDLALHVTYIKTFANGVPLWPDNPIYVGSHLRYPAGVDLFNGLLSIVNVSLIRGLVWVGLLASLATFYAFYRWGGLFGVAGFLFNGGVVGFEFLNNFEFKDYQGQNTIAWKSIPLSMFVTQRGLLYAIPAGVLLLWHWRQKFYGKTDATSAPAATANVDAGSGSVEASARDAATVEDATAAPSGADAVSNPTPTAADAVSVGPLPFWAELLLYCSMPIFHVHTFLALSAVLASFFVFGDAAMRKHIGMLIGAALVPATFFVWLITDQFHAGSMLKWQPGWVQNQGDFKMPFFKFWGVNFGFWFPLLIWYIGSVIYRCWQERNRLTAKLPEDLAFLCPAIGLFILGLLVKTAPWEWDNLKLMFWGYFIVLPFLWKGLISQWVLPLRIVACIALFGSGFVSLFGGLAVPGYGFANRAEWAEVAVAVRRLPIDARFATFPTFNHPVLLQGRKVVLGYPGHLWTQGFDYHQEEAKLNRLMHGEPGWQEAAKALGVRYIFWGREENTNYPNSSHPWESTLTKVASGPWGAIYDVDRPIAPRS